MSPPSQSHLQPPLRKPDVPFRVMKKILSHLPLSALASFRGVSTSFLSSIRSLPATLPFPQDPLFFLFYSWANRGYMVYHPLRDRWFFCPGPRFPTASSGSHFLITNASRYEPGIGSGTELVSLFYFFNPFSRVTTTIPLPLRSGAAYHGVLLHFNHNTGFKIVARSFEANTLETYDSESGLWTHHSVFPWLLEYNVNAVFLDGIVYVMDRWLIRLLRFNLEGSFVSAASSEIPLKTCKHMTVFEGRLFIVGWAFTVTERFGPYTPRIEVWELARWEPPDWRLVSSMPDDTILEFAPMLNMQYLRACSGAGIICFYHLYSDRLVTYDLLRRSWDEPSTCPMFRDQRAVWVGHAVEPDANVVLR